MRYNNLVLQINGKQFLEKLTQNYAERYLKSE